MTITHFFERVAKCHVNVRYIYFSLFKIDKTAYIPNLLNRILCLYNIVSQIFLRYRVAQTNLKIAICVKNKRKKNIMFNIWHRCDRRTIAKARRALVTPVYSPATVVRHPLQPPTLDRRWAAVVSASIRHARAKLRRPRRQPPRAAERHSTQPQIVGRRRRFAKNGRWGRTGGDGDARGRQRGEGKVRISARSCVRAWSWSFGTAEAEEVNIVQYDWPAPRRRVFRFSFLSPACLLREDQSLSLVESFSPIFPSIIGLKFHESLFRR